MQKNDPMIAYFPWKFQANSDFEIYEYDFEIAAGDLGRRIKANNIQLIYDLISQILLTIHKHVP